jgi:hypothetical protein
LIRYCRRAAAASAAATVAAQPPPPPPGPTATAAWPDRPGPYPLHSFKSVRSPSESDPVFGPSVCTDSFVSRIVCPICFSLKIEIYHKPIQNQIRIQAKSVRRKRITCKRVQGLESYNQREGKERASSGYRPNGPISG